jgi:O-antigen ligase
MSFWSGERMQNIWNALGSGINQAHNGYLEQYLNLGYVGVGFIIVIMLAAVLNIRKHLAVSPSAGILRLCLVVIAALYNYTEASFYGISNMWVLFLAGTIDVQGVTPDAPVEQPAVPAAVPERVTSAVAVARRRMSRTPRTSQTVPVRRR